MKAAMMQPAFMPWQGYFELLMKADVFILLDDFQFSVQSYHQRNRLFTSPGRVDWWSVPVQKKSSFKKPLTEVLVNDALPWRVKLLKRFRQNYHAAAHHAEIFNLLSAWLDSGDATLAALNIRLIAMVMERLRIGTRILLSSEFPATGVRSARVGKLLEACGADVYLCARGAFEYMLEDGVFPLPGVETLFQDFLPRPYRQVGVTGAFEPRLSIIDALANLEAEAVGELVGRGTASWISWDELAGTARHPLNARRQDPT